MKVLKQEINASLAAGAEGIEVGSPHHAGSRAEGDGLHDVGAAPHAAVDEDVAAIAKGGPNAVREAKALVRTIPTLDEDAAFAYAAEKVTGLFASDEAAEGLTAFVEKRPPAWVKP